MQTLSLPTDAPSVIVTAASLVEELKIADGEPNCVPFTDRRSRLDGLYVTVKWVHVAIGTAGPVNEIAALAVHPCTPTFPALVKPSMGIDQGILVVPDET